jgi:uncharacterized repeat protein (TIGR01451 family)
VVTPVVVAALLGLGPRGAAADPPGVAPRFAAKGWLGIVQAGAPSVGTDVDSNQSTVDSSQAHVTIPAGAIVQWAGLHWAGDQAARADGSPPRCAGAPADAAPATPPPAPQLTNVVRLSIGDGPYESVTAADASPILTPAGAAAFQAYADVTAGLRRYGGRSAVTDVSVTVADVQVATGPGCVGGWSLMIVYGYPNGPDKTFAPAYESLAVYDPIFPTGASATLTGLVTPAAGQVSAAVGIALLGGGPPVTPTLSGNPVGTSSGTGYQQSIAPLPPAALAAGATSAPFTVAADGDAFAAMVVAIGVTLPVRMSLPVTAVFSPTTVAVGSVARFTVTVRDDADVPASGVTITAALPDSVDLVDHNSAYEESTGVWTVGTLAAHGTATLTLNVRVNAAGSFTTSARVTSSAVDQAPPAPTVSATIVAEIVTGPTTAPAIETTQPTAADQTGSGASGLWDLPPGVLVGLGVFGLGLLLLLVIMVRQRPE